MIVFRLNDQLAVQLLCNDLRQGAFSNAYGAFERDITWEFEKICHAEMFRRLRAAYPAFAANAIAD
jgi:hypothetical protein